MPVNRDATELGDYTNTGELFVRERLAGPGAAALFSDGPPSGVLSGERWQLAIDITTGVVWQNTNGGTAWSEYLANVSGLGFVFGAGLDGDVTFDGSSTVLGIVPTSGVYRLGRPLSARNMHVASGVVLACDGYPVTVSRTLSGAGFISNNGNAAVGAVGGLARATTMLTGGTAGGAGGTNVSGTAGGATVQGPSFYSTTNAAGGTPNGNPGADGGVCHGGGGGAGGSGNSGGVGGTITMQTVPTRYDWMLTRCLLDGRYASGAAYPGPTGGGGGGAASSAGPITGQGGGGGGAAGWLSLAARYSTYAGIVEANGGSGAGTQQGRGAGGGGGAGGVVICVVGGGVLPTCRALGGTGGIGVNLNGATGTVGGNGGAGGAGFLIAWRLND